MVRRLRWLAWGAFAPLLLAAAVAVQGQGGTCPAFIDTTLAALEGACGGLSRDVACYGAQRVAAEFVEAVPEDSFSRVADRAPLVSLRRIAAAPLDPVAEQWGAAVLNVAASLPQTVPGQGVVFVLLGDGDLTNAVDPATAFTVAAPVPVSVGTAARLRGGPGTTFNTLATVPAGTTVQADAVDGTGGWVRVVANGIPGWMARELLPGIDPAALPVYSEGARTPMQSFYFSGGIGQSECTSAPPALLVQTPRNITVQLDVNEATIAVGSTVVFEQPTADQLQISVLDGQATVNNLIVPAGWTAFAPMTAADGGASAAGDDLLAEPGPTATSAPVIDNGNDTLFGSAGGVITDGAGNSTLFDDAGDATLLDADGDVRPIPGLFDLGGASATAAPIRTLARGAVSGPWDGCRVFSAEDRTRLGRLAQLPAALLNYPVGLPAQPGAVCESPEQAAARAAADYQAAIAARTPTPAPATAAPSVEVTPPPSGVTPLPTATFYLFPSLEPVTVTPSPTTCNDVAGNVGCPTEDFNPIFVAPVIPIFRATATNTPSAPIVR